MVPPTLPAYGSYYWCVQTTMPGPAAAANSEARAFEYTILKTPANNAYLKTAKTGVYKFSWLQAVNPSDGVTPATLYQLDIATDAGFSNIVFTTNTSVLTQSVPLSAGTYFWRITPYFGLVAGSTTPVRTFFIGY